eukprot:11214653-Lingulodinium_polyedra.AAC.1
MEDASARCLDQFRATMPVVETQAKDPAEHFPNRWIYCGVPRLSIGNVGKSARVADLQNIPAFTFGDARAMLDVC